MSRTVWKYELQLGRNALAMPRGAELLTVQQQGARGGFFLWARVDPSAPQVRRIVEVGGTGHDAPEGVYIATTVDGAFVWHFFDAGEAR